MTATPTSTFVIVGAGLAGAKAAETLRAEGFDGRLLLLGEEAERPYERRRCPRPTCAARQTATASMCTRKASTPPTTSSCALHPGRRDQPGSRQLELVSGERISYERLLLATGAAPRRLPLPGAELDGVRYLRTRVTPTAWRPPPPAPSGSWWWGPAGSAARPPPLSASSAGRSPWSARIPHPLARVLGEVAAVYRDLHADHGVRLRSAPGSPACAATAGSRPSLPRTGAPSTATWC